MKLFTLGPVEMYEDTLTIDAKQLPYFRTNDFSKTVLGCAADIKALANAPDDSEVIFLTASGTGAMEAAIANCFYKYDKILVIDGGGFGHRFAELCAFHGIANECLTVPFGEALTEDMLSQYDGKDFTALVINTHETSTGQLYDMDMIHRFCNDNDLYLVADAVGSFLTDPLDVLGLGIDAMIVSTQKALALAPGMSVVILSRRIFEDRVQHIKPFSVYFDFKEYRINGMRGQTPYTPAVRIILEMSERLRRLRQKGLENVLSDIAELARDFRARVSDLPLNIPEYPLSNAVTPLIFPNGGARAMFEWLSETHDVWVNPNGGALEDKIIRVAHIGNLTIEDNAMLVALLRERLMELAADE